MAEQALSAEQKAKLVQKAYIMQELLLDNMIWLLENNKMAPTDRATAARWLKDNDYRVSAHDLPPDLIRMMEEMGVKVQRTMPEA